MLQAITSSLAPRSEQQLGDPGDPLAQRRRVAAPVGEPGGVAEVDEVLLRQRDQALVEDGEAADAGVEHRHRQRRVELGHRADGAVRV